MLFATVVHWIGREALFCLLQLGFASMVPAAKDKHVDGSKIAECSGGEDFAKLLSLSDPQAAFQALQGYFSAGYSAGQTRVSARNASIPVYLTALHSQMPFVFVGVCVLG